MPQTVARKLVSNIPLKLFSLLLGYTIWYIISSHQTITRTLTIPVCFYNTTNDCQIKAPESITITLRGKRSSFRNTNLDDLALHIDATTLSKQTTVMPINSSQLFLPENIALVHYVPSPLFIEKNIQQTTAKINESTIT